MAASTIVLEFNELTPALMDRFIGEGMLPGFARLRDQSLACITDAGESGPTLEPWIQWTTVHTGLPYSRHGVFDLSDGPKLKARRIWDFLSDAGKTVWVCGSMNAAVQAEQLRGHILPDPWAIEVEPRPLGYFDAYYHLVRRYVQDYTREKPPVSRADFVRFARFMILNGLSVKTALTTLRQLVSERAGAPKWRRAAILDRLQWDLFRANYRRLKPAFSTFFLNSTAHYQHYYWRDLEPARFALKPTETHRLAHADAIAFGYRKMDEIVQECLALADRDTTIVLCTALGQQPLVKYEDQGGKQVFKAYDPEALAKIAEIETPYQYVPVMAEEFQFRFRCAEDAAEGERRLARLTLNDGAAVLRIRRDGAQLYLGCALSTFPNSGATISGTDIMTPVAFDAVFYPLEGVKSGGHHPDGILWISTPDRRGRTLERKVSLDEIAPTLAALCGVAADGMFPASGMAEILALKDHSFTTAVAA